MLFNGTISHSWEGGDGQTWEALRTIELPFMPCSGTFLYLRDTTRDGGSIEVQFDEVAWDVEAERFEASVEFTDNSRAEKREWTGRNKYRAERREDKTVEKTQSVFDILHMLQYRPWVTHVDTGSDRCDLGV